MSTLVAGLYQVWTGTKQAALAVNGNQLLQQVSPAAAALLAVLVPIFEPLGIEHLFNTGTALAGASSSGTAATAVELMQSTVAVADAMPLATAATEATAAAAAAVGGTISVAEFTTAAAYNTLVGYPYTPAAVAAILLSCLLGLSVTLSSYWAIGVTSPLTFNVVGHAKTVIILAGGVMLFHDAMNLAKGFGLLLALTGVVMYSC
jgi:solute carrier family 35 protein E3